MAAKQERQQDWQELLAQWRPAACPSALSRLVWISQKQISYWSRRLASLPPSPRFVPVHVAAAGGSGAISLHSARLDSMEKMASLKNADRDSARNREIQVRDRTPKILAYLVTAGTFGMLVFMLFKPIPTENRDIVNIMQGVLSSTVGHIVAHYYGSTKGS
jgi:hypothetical protein